MYFYRHTAIVLLISLTGSYLYLNLFSAGVPDNIFSAFIGLFIPAGIWSSVSTFGMAPILALIFTNILDEFFEKKFLSQINRIFFTLIFLFLATIISDYVIWHYWNSMYFFLEPFGIDIPHTKMGL